MARLSYLRKFLTFLLHQFVGTWGTGFFAAFTLISVAEACQIINRNLSMRWAYWILTENPYYPVQIALAFYLGGVIWKRFPSRSAFYVWFLPFLLLVYAVATRTTWNPQWTSVLLVPKQEISPLSHYFGWGCQPAAHCIDRLLFTMPLYASVSYSIAARICELNRRRRNGPDDEDIV